MGHNTSMTEIYCNKLGLCINRRLLKLMNVYTKCTAIVPCDMKYCTEPRLFIK